jgi:hypothetical protein
MPGGGGYSHVNCFAMHLARVNLRVSFVRARTQRGFYPAFQQIVDPTFVSFIYYPTLYLEGIYPLFLFLLNRRVLIAIATSIFKTNSDIRGAQIGGRRTSGITIPVLLFKRLLLRLSGGLAITVLTFLALADSKNHALSKSGFNPR